ncbi:MAG: DUF4185 domain-containing protein [Planctomycetes bacterium]|nr:DUF4185 domain-containing protein [Planctomycetota bacterium]
MRLLPMLLLFLAVASAAEALWPMPHWPKAAPDEAGLEAAKLVQARDYALTGDGSGMIIRHGRLVMHWGDLRARYDLKSTTKSFGAAALGLALKDGKIKSLDDKARLYHPTLGEGKDANAQPGWLDKITIRHLLVQTAGFEKPGGTARMLFEPGTRWAYSDSGPNWLAECITLAYRQDLNALMFERIFTPIGIKPADLTWRPNAYRPREINGIARREFGAGIHANVDAMARFGYLFLRRGRWQDKQLLPEDYVAPCGRLPDALRGRPTVDPNTYGKASDHYGYLWWNNADGMLKDVPRDAFWSWGLYDSLIVVIPSLDIVAARAGKSWKDTPEHYAKLAPFLGPIVASVKGQAKPRGAPYPPSPVIKAVEWAPKETIIRLAKGSDNWPMTWADDDALYTAYGDGNGFEPFVPTKLSLGFARVLGDPPDVRGVNIRSESGEQVGDGSRGRKASGMLAVDGTLYMWARNAANAQLAWSRDRGRAWTWADWKLTTGFGCPTFLNFGRNYAGARDRFAYIYSPDGDSAYTPSDRMVLARVPRDRLADREAYEFFAKGGWTKDIARREAVFEHPGRCYRSGVSYSAPLKRYLWCQIIPGGDTRFRGGLAIYDAPEPWGPWTTAFFTEEWDVGPGESASLPTKWMSADGRTVHLVFSGDDSFSVRKATLTIAQEK